MESAILGQAFREYLRIRRLWPWIGLSLICMLLAFEWKNLDASSSNQSDYATVSAMLVFRLVALASAIFTTAIVSQEVEQKTIVYLLTRPVPRWKLLLLRYAASVTVVALVAIFAALITSFGAFRSFGGNALLAKDVLALAVGAMAYGALFLFISLLFNRALLICALFAFGWESIIPDLPGEMYRLSIFSYLQSIAQHPSDSSSQGLSLLTGSVGDKSLTVLASWVTLGILIAVMLGLSAWWFTHFEYVPRDDAE